MQRIVVGTDPAQIVDHPTPAQLSVTNFDPFEPRLDHHAVAHESRLDRAMILVNEAFSEDGLSQWDSDGRRGALREALFTPIGSSLNGVNENPTCWFLQLIQWARQSKRLKPGRGERFTTRRACLYERELVPNAIRVLSMDDDILHARGYPEQTRLAVEREIQAYQRYEEEARVHSENFERERQAMFVGVP
ncbi:MAG: hypothetical protein EB015_19750, partial [Methylocystaceae bacterium]|nr:hypothetical protein [Methylocystaceae bacterium]